MKKNMKMKFNPFKWGKKTALKPKLDVSINEVKKGDKLSKLDLIKLRFRPSSCFLVTMLFNNGTSKQFVVSSNKEMFSYKGKSYYLRYEDAWFDLSYNQYRLMYFDDYSCPIDRKVLKQGDAAFFAVTSSNLKPLIKMEYVKALAQSQDISKYLLINMVVSVFTLMLVFVNIYFAYKGAG